MSKLYFLLFSFIIITDLYSQTSLDIIKDYITVHLSELDLEATDVNDLMISSEHLSNTSGLTHSYVVQKVNGYKLHNGIANVSLKNGQVFFFGNELVKGIQSKVNTSLITLSASDAIIAFSQAENLPLTGLQLINDSLPEIKIFNTGGISQNKIKTELVYHHHTDQSIRLCWDFDVHLLNGQHWWSLKIDATNGNILEKVDWVRSCSFSACVLHDPINGHQIKNEFNNQVLAPATDQYTVFAIPTESPNHGPRTTVIGPYDPIASPYGWHDVDGNPGAEFTTTVGNNVISQEDQNGNNGNGLRVNGGAVLDFNVPLNINQAPTNYEDASIVNLFYMNNIMHDVWYHYGFDEASGNFQENNYGKGGIASDFVYADAQDGSGLNNANFGTPTDGNNPRMQMFLWSAPASANMLTINSPATYAGAYPATEGNLGPPVPTTPITADLAIVIDNNPDNQDACDPLTNAGDLSGKIAVIRRGACTFVNKIVAAENAGAVAVIMVNNVATAPIAMGGTDPGIGIPSVMISQADGDPLIAALLSGTTINATLQDPGGTFQLDGSFDNGIIAHEYGHGISNRLTGGASNSNCLNNAEQMGEGWSDWFGLMLTIEPGDLGTDRRGIGTYAIGESTTGTGIRPTAYSTDFAINGSTYALTNNTGVISQPHGIGYVWCTMLWDLSWAFIDTYGYDPDIYYGTGGNNIVMELVIEALKLQPCSVGFVDGRDAILNADMALNNGVNHCLIWNVFANRGVGESASQGSRNSRTDQSEAFDVPNGITAPLSNCISSLNVFLPIELVSFQAKYKNNIVELDWSIESEYNNAYFAIERSSDGIHFTQIGIIDSKGNTDVERNYNFLDHNPLNGTSYYRLRIVDLQNIYSFSETRSVNVQTTLGVNVFPNPSKSDLNISFSSEAENQVTVKVYDFRGVEFLSRAYKILPGINTKILNLDDFSAGNYMLTIRDTDGNINIRKTFIKF